MKSRYGTEISKDDYREILNLSREINALFEENYIKEIRPEPIHPIRRMKSMSGQKAVGLYKTMLRSMLYEEQDNPGRRFENWKEQLYNTMPSWDKELKEAILKLTQSDYAELRKKDPDVTDIKFYYNTSLVKNENTGELETIDTTDIRMEVLFGLQNFLAEKGYIEASKLDLDGD